MVPRVVEKVTVPVGVITVPVELSVTVTVQVAVPFEATLEGEQLTETVTLLLSMVTLAVPELVAWTESPPYEAVIVTGEELWLPEPGV